MVNATKFQAYLVGADPSQYVQATVPFSFKDEGKPMRASQKFSAQTCGTFKALRSIQTVSRNGMAALTKQLSSWNRLQPWTLSRKAARRRRR